MPGARQKRPRRRENLTADQVIADQVKALRNGRGISQQSLANELGWRQSTIARIESGDRAISVSDLLALCWALNVAPGYLLAGSFQSDDVPVHKTLRVAPRDMLKWIRGGEPLPGLDYRAYFENIPDDEWLELYGPTERQRATAALQYERAEKLLEAGAERDPDRPPSQLRPDQEARHAEERERRRKQLEATKRAKRKST